MNTEIESYNALQSDNDQLICNMLMEQINSVLPHGTSKVWHGSPVWFMDDNPIVGYSKLKKGIQLLFWSGQSFESTGLKACGKYQAAEVYFNHIEEVEYKQLAEWLEQSISVQWDYKNIVKRQGVLERLSI